jgi:hypothetical protein
MDRDYRVFLYDPKILIQVGTYDPETSRVSMYDSPEWNELMKTMDKEGLIEYLEKNGLTDRIHDASS